MSKRTMKRFRSVLITLFLVMAADIAISFASNVPMLPDAPKPKSNVPMLPDAPKPKSNVPMLPDAPKP
jgi:hypothetical protein